MRLYLDMDGVLCHFDKRAMSLWTELKPDESGWYDIEKHHWEMIEHDTAFWSDMEWQPGGRELWAAAQNMDPWLLSAYNPAVMRSTVIGKMDWINKELQIPTWKAKFCMREDKQHFARHPSGQRNVIVEDNMKNCVEWEKAGGIAIFHKHTDTDSTIKHLHAINSRQLDLTTSHLLLPQR